MINDLELLNGNIVIELVIVFATIVLSGIGTILWFSIKRYILKQDEKYDLVVGEFKDYSTAFNESVNMLTKTRMLSSIFS